MRVAQVIDSLAWGGAQKMQVLLAQVAKDRDIDMMVVSLRDSGDAPFERMIQSFGTRVIRFPSKSLLDLKRIYKLARFLRREGVDLIHAHLSYANIVGTLVGRLAKIPAIATLRTSGIDPDFYNPWRYRLETWALRNWATRVMANGYSIAEKSSKRLSGRPIEIIPNAVFVEQPMAEVERDAIRLEIMGETSRPLIISVGRLAAPKGYHDLLEAFRVVLKEVPKAFLIIVGSGALGPEIEALIDAHGIGENVLLLGAREDVPKLLMASDIFVSASHWEGMPVAVIEAMAAGLPVVATDVGDNARVMLSDAGLLVPPHQPQEIADAICALLERPNWGRSLGEKARERIQRDYHPEVWVDRFISFYESILGETELQSKKDSRTADLEPNA